MIIVDPDTILTFGIHALWSSRFTDAFRSENNCMTWQGTSCVYLCCCWPAARYIRGRFVLRTFIFPKLPHNWRLRGISDTETVGTDILIYRNSGSLKRAVEGNLRR